MKEGRVDHRIGKGFPLEGALSNENVIFDTEVPVFVDWDEGKDVGKARGYINPTDGHIHVNIEFNLETSRNLQKVFDIITTKALSFAGPAKLEPEVPPEICEGRANRLIEVASDFFELPHDFVRVDASTRGQFPTSPVDDNDAYSESTKDGK